MSKSEDMSSTEIIDSFVNELLGILPILKIIHDFFIKIINVIPNSLSVINTLNRLYIYNFIELVLLIISITLINNYSPDKILVPDSPEGTIFIVFLIFIFFNVIYLPKQHLRHSHFQSSISCSHELPGLPAATCGTEGRTSTF